MRAATSFWHARRRTPAAASASANRASVASAAAAAAPSSWIVASPTRSAPASRLSAYSATCSGAPALGSGAPSASSTSRRTPSTISESAHGAPTGELPDARRQPNQAVVGVVGVASVGAQAGLVVGQRSHEGVDDAHSRCSPSASTPGSATRFGATTARTRPRSDGSEPTRRRGAHAQSARGGSGRTPPAPPAAARWRGAAARASCARAARLGGEHQREVAAVGAVRLPRREQLEELARAAGCCSRIAPKSRCDVEVTVTAPPDSLARMSLGRPDGP